MSPVKLVKFDAKAYVHSRQEKRAPATAVVASHSHFQFSQASAQMRSCHTAALDVGEYPHRTHPGSAYRKSDGHLPMIFRTLNLPPHEVPEENHKSVEKAAQSSEQCVGVGEKDK